MEYEYRMGALPTAINCHFHAKHFLEMLPTPSNFEARTAGRYIAGILYGYG